MRVMNRRVVLIERHAIVAKPYLLRTRARGMRGRLKFPTA